MACAVLLGAGTSQAALVFNFSGSTGNASADAAFDAAAARWAAVLQDSVTINLTRGFSALGSGILGQASSSDVTQVYTAVRNALIADAISSDDVTSSGSLGTTLSMLVNRTSNNPNGAGSATPYLDNDGDANNTTIRLNTANAKALGLLAANDPGNDGTIEFSTAFTWDFDPSDGITAGAFDFVGVAAHEIGHLLGFVSGVDVLDFNSSGPFYTDNQFTFVSPLDLFRYSSLSGTGVIDWTADSRAKYLSLNGGTTAIAEFSTGVTWGDGNQASHWKDNLGIGILDPTGAPGEALLISATDLRAMDVIGWNRSTAVPEPATIGLSLVGLSVVAFNRRRRTAR